MAPKIDTMEALRALAAQDGDGLKTERGEFVMDAAMSRVVRALSDELGGLGARSRVVRRLIAKGARMELAEREARTQPAPAAEDPEEARKAARRERDRKRREALAAASAQA